MTGAITVTATATVLATAMVGVTATVSVAASLMAAVDPPRELVRARRLSPCPLRHCRPVPAIPLP